MGPATRRRSRSTSGRSRTAKPCARACESALVEPTAAPEALAPESGDSVGEGAFADAPPVACVDSQARAAGVEPALVQHGIVVYQGEPAEVFVFARDADFLAVVVADASGSCRTVASQVVPSGDP